MSIALGISLCAIVVAPWVGRWRANLWLRRTFAEMDRVSHPATAEATPSVLLTQVHASQPR